MNSARIVVITCLGLLPVWLTSSAQTFRQLVTVTDGMGGVSTNTVLLAGVSYRHTGAGAQPGGIVTSSNMPTLNYAGFLQAGDVKRPFLDTDGDGVVDELADDNDGDGLADVAETSGTAFGGYALTSPNDPDTDKDGMNDGEEAAGMYDPLDFNHRLAILSLSNSSGTLTMRWIGKGGGTTNSVMWCTSLVADRFTNVLYGAAYGGGVFPWFKVTNTHAWTDQGKPQVYFRLQTGP